MDTENFILERGHLLDRLGTRRAVNLETYPFQMARDFGIPVPAWVRLALSFVSKGSPISRILEIGLPLAAPFIFRRNMPILGRLVQRFFTPKS